MIPRLSRSSQPIFGLLQSRQLGFAWALCVVIGGSIISSSPSGEPRRLFFPVVIMGLYGAFAYNRWAALFGTASEGYKTSTITQLADSVYFMGFVWTLWALIDSFLLTANLPTGDAIFRSFGYALVTTAFGMFIRLLILQFLYTATDQSQQAQASVEEILRQFAASVSGTKQTLDEWHVSLRTAANETGSANAKLASGIRKVSEELVRAVGKATEEYLGMLDDTAKELQATAKTLREEQIKSINEAEAAYRLMLTGIAKELHGRINAVGVHLEKTLAVAVERGLGDFGTQIAADLKEVREAVTNLTSRLKRASTGLGKSVDELDTKINVIASTLETAAEDFERSSIRITRALTGASLTISTTADVLGESMKSAASSIKTATQSAIDSLSNMSGPIAEGIKKGLESVSFTPEVSVSTDPAFIRQTIIDAVVPIDQKIDRINESIKLLQQSTSGRQQSTGNFEGQLPTGGGRVDRIQDATKNRRRWPFGPRRQNSL